MKKALVLGGYGLIGSACMRGLQQAGFDVTGLGRSAVAASTADPDASWVIREIRSLAPKDWRDLLSGVDVVVNASGALQDGGRDDLEAIHVTAVERLVEAAGPAGPRIVQISAAGVSDQAATAFFRSKARGDAAIAAGATEWVILRPTLVLSPDAYGGTALLRAVAAMPGILPKVLPNSPVQTVFIDDVVNAVVAAADGRVPPGTVADLTETGSRSFADLTADVRRWLGVPAPLATPPVPNAVLGIMGRIADALGHLGWRSPMRTTALRALEDGIRGDPAAWDALGGTPCRSLEDTLANLPATRQERLFARAFLALPLSIAVLSVFWILSGLIALSDIPAANSVLVTQNVPGWVASGTVVGGAVADIFLGAAILWRPWARRAALGMVALSIAYMAGGIIAAPDLWSDPLGPMLKVLPGTMLAALVWLLLEDR